MKKTETAATPNSPAAIQQRIGQLESELAAVESQITESKGTAAGALMAGADPLALEQAGTTLRARQAALSGAIQTLKRERANAVTAGLEAASTACRKAQDGLRGEYRAAELETFRMIDDALDTLAAVRVTLDGKIESARVDGMAALGLKPGDKEASNFPSSACSDGFARQARVIVLSALK